MSNNIIIDQELLDSYLQLNGSGYGDGYGSGDGDGNG